MNLCVYHSLKQSLISKDLHVMKCDQVLTHVNTDSVSNSLQTLYLLGSNGFSYISNLMKHPTV